MGSIEVKFISSSHCLSLQHLVQIQHNLGPWGKSRYGTPNPKKRSNNQKKNNGPFEEERWWASSLWIMMCLPSLSRRKIYRFIDLWPVVSWCFMFVFHLKWARPHHVKRLEIHRWTELWNHQNRQVSMQMFEKCESDQARVQVNSHWDDPLNPLHAVLMYMGQEKVSDTTWESSILTSLGAS